MHDGAGADREGLQELRSHGHATGELPGEGPVAAVAEPRARPTAYCGCVAIWIRLPQLSSKTAVVTGPISKDS